MIRFGAKRKQHRAKIQAVTHGTPCPKCGAVGNEPCKNISNHVAMKNHHKERV